MKRFLRSYWPIIFTLSVWFVFVSPYVLKNKVPFPSTYLATFFPPWSATSSMPVKNNAMPDVITQIYPWKNFTIDTWKSGQIPLWNPYSFAGTPHAANYQSAVFSPVNLLFFVLPFVHAWSISILLQPVAAGFFMYLFTRQLGLSKESSTLSATAWMFCGFMVTWMAYGTLGYAALYLPLILWGVEREKQKPSWWNGLCVTGGIGLSFVSGHFQISLYVFLLSIAYIFYRFWGNKRQNARILLFLLGGLFVALPQLVLTGVAYIQSTRQMNVLQHEVIPWNYLVTTFAPDYFGNPVTRNDWFGHYAEWSSYLGVIPLFLALFAIIRVRRGTINFFALTALVALLLAYQSPVNDLLYILRVPVLSTSAASRIIVLFSFSASVVAAFGLDKLLEDVKRRSVATFVIYSVCLFVGITALWGVTRLGNLLSADKMEIALRNLFLPSAILASAIVIFFLMIAFRRRAVRVMGISVLMLLAGFDSTRFAIKWMPFDPQEFVYPQTELLVSVKEQVGLGRAFGNWGNEVNSFFGIGSLEGYDAMYNARYGEFVTSLSEGIVGTPSRSVATLPRGGTYTQSALNLLNVTHLVHRISDGRFVWAYPFWNYPIGTYELVYKDASYEVHRNVNAYPRAFLVDSYRVETENQKIIQALFSPDMDRKKMVVLEKYPVFDPKEGDGKAEILSYTPNEVTIKTQSNSPKLLFLSDAYDIGWEAWINGKITNVFRANYAFRAVSIPPGDNTVVFTYNPPYFQLAIWVSLLTTFVIAIKSIRIIYENRNL